MKRLSGILITFLFLLQVFTGIQISYSDENTGHSRIESLPGGLDEDHSSAMRNENGLVGQWHFDEGSGSEAKDSSGNENDGTLIVGGGDDANNKWVDGVGGRALWFDGTNDYVNIPHNDHFEPDHISVVCLINIKKIAAISQQIINHRNGGSSWIGYGIELGPNGIIHGSISTGQSSNHKSSVEIHNDKIDLDNWHHIVMTWDGNSLKIYLDGNLESSDSDGIGGNIAHPNLPLRIGYRADAEQPEYFNGMVDEVSIYNRALSANEISTHYNSIMNSHTEQDEYGGSWFDDFNDESGISEITAPIPLLKDEHTVGLWHFDEGTGNEAKDVSGNGNHGTLHGSEESDWVDGRFEKGLDFDGTGEHVDMGDPGDNSLEASGSYTVESWIKTGTTDSDMIISKKGDGPRGFYLATTNDGKLKTHFQGDVGVVSYDSISVINDNIWHYVAVVKDTGGVVTYIDGNLDSSSDSNPGDCSNTKNFKIGVSEHSQSFWYTGAIDEVRISNTARTTDEIRRNYEGGLAIRNGKIEFNRSQYMRPITIMNDGDALSDYQIEVNITTENFDYSHAKENGGDIRFYDSNGNKLSYWIEEWNTSGDSKVWVNVTNIPNGDSHIWMDYGNPNAESESDGVATFDLFDDFEDNDLDWVIWGRESGNGNYAISNSELHMTQSGLSNQNIYTNTKWNESYIHEFYANTTDKYRSHLYAKNSDTGHTANFYETGSGPSDELRTYDSPATYKLIPINSWGSGFHVFTIVRTGSETRFSIDYSIIGKTQNNYPSGDLDLRFSTDNGGELFSDWVRIRKFASIEPTTSLGGEKNIYFTNTTLTSTPITPPPYQPWNMLSILKTEPENTYINVSIINTETNATVPGYENRTGENILLHRLTDLGVTSIRLKAYFSGNGSTTPSLDSWGVEWTAGDSWRDSFTGDGKIDRDNSSVIGTKVDEHTAALWRFDEESGNRALDATGNQNHGTLRNMADAARVNGRFGKAMEFDGVDDYVEVPYHETLDMSDEITIEAWINTRSIDTTYILRKSGTAYSYELRMELTGQLSMIFEGVTIFSVDTILVDEWFYVVGTYDGSHMTLYINGEPDNQIEYSGGIEPGDDELYIGAPSSNPGMGFNGTIDEVCISNISRTPQEIREAFRAGISIRGGQVQLAQNKYDPWVGGNWTKASESAPWGAREYHTSVQYQNKIWVIGGYSGGRKNDVWYSTDGNSWSSATFSAPWNARTGHTSVIFNNQIWVIGGHDGGVINNDAWYSSDGVSWSPATLSAPWSGRMGHTSVVFDNKMWVIGGTTGGISDVWCSTDGISWSSTTLSAPWSSRVGHTSVVFDNKIWVIGGHNNSEENDVWYSADGANWVEATSSAPWSGRNGHTSLVYGNKIWVIGGAANPQKNDVWYSINGVNWTLATGAAQWSARLRHSSIVFNDKLWVIGGYIGGGIYKNDTWYSDIPYYNNATLRSNNITIPTNKTWESFHCSRSVPDNTYLNISIHDADTNEILLTNSNSTEELYFDMIHINSIIHPTIYLKAVFRSNRTETPILYDWAVNWTTGTNEIIPPELLEDLPGVLEIIEDTPENNIIDLADYFSDIYSSISPSIYALQSDPSNDNITIALNGSHLDVTRLANNWTGNVSVMANCTNMHSISTSTKMFNITVTPVDDAPAWNSTPPAITVKQGTSNTSEYSLDGHVVDAEEDVWEISISSDDANISVIIDGEGHMVITHSGDFIGSTFVIASVFQFDNHLLFSKALSNNPVIVR